jgi:restriction system protein
MVVVTVRRQAQHRHNQALLDVRLMAKMTGIEFEGALKALFEHQGYRVKLTKTTGDFGADLLMRKAGKLTATQAKRYKENVGIAGIQEVIGAREYYHTDRAMCVTTAGYTKAARALAGKAHVTLWGREELARAVTQSSQENVLKRSLREERTIH